MCVDCVAGKYQDEVGEACCKACSLDKFSKALKSNTAGTCKNCPKGKYTDLWDTGATDCFSKIAAKGVTVRTAKDSAAIPAKDSAAMAIKEAVMLLRQDFAFIDSSFPFNPAMNNMTIDTSIIIMGTLVSVAAASFGFTCRRMLIKEQLKFADMLNRLVAACFLTGLRRSFAVAAGVFVRIPVIRNKSQVLRMKRKNRITLQNCFLVCLLLLVLDGEEAVSTI